WISHVIVGLLPIIKTRSRASNRSHFAADDNDRDVFYFLAAEKRLRDHNLAFRAAGHRRRVNFAGWKINGDRGPTFLHVFRRNDPVADKERPALNLEFQVSAFRTSEVKLVAV